MTIFVTYVQTDIFLLGQKLWREEAKNVDKEIKQKEENLLNAINWCKYETFNVWGVRWHTFATLKQKASAFD